MKIMAFDQSTNLTGFCLMDDGEYIMSGTIDKHRIKDTEIRVADMGLAICTKIKEHKPDLVVIEDIQNQSSVKTVIHLARLQGCVILYCASKGIPLKILHPTEWRKVLGYVQGPKVKREELKKQSIDYVNNNLGLNVESEDECEAIDICVAANMLYNN